MRAVLLDPRADPAWSGLVDAAEAATPFHHRAWIDLIARTYRYPVAAVTVLDAGRPVAGLPVAFVASRLTGRRLVALPFTDACPPLVAPEAPPGALDMLVEALTDLRRRRAVPLEIRAEVPEAGRCLRRHVGHVLDLSAGHAAVQRAFAPRVRRHVRRSLREGVTVRRGTDPGALGAFFALHVRTRRRLGVPTQPRAFIDGLASLFASGHGHVTLGELDGRVIAAAVFLRHRDRLVYKYGASHEAFLHVRPNNALFDEEIRRACEERCVALDFGRTDLDQTGLRAFKSGWGARETPLGYTYSDVPRRAGGVRHEGLLAAVIRRSPPATGRIVGRALYRHVG